MERRYENLRSNGDELLTLGEDREEEEQEDPDGERHTTASKRSERTMAVEARLQSLSDMWAQLERGLEAKSSELVEITDRVREIESKCADYALSAEVWPLSISHTHSVFCVLLFLWFPISFHVRVGQPCFSVV